MVPKLHKIIILDEPAELRPRDVEAPAVEAEGEGDTLDFEKTMELPYLEAVVRETPRVRVHVDL